MKKSLFALSLVALAATQAQAYQTELMGEIGFADDVTTAALEGRYFFAPVTVGNQPHAEAWFLNRNSNAALKLTYTDVDNVGDSTTIGADFNYFVPATQFYVGGKLAKNTESDTPTNYGLAVGFLPMNGLLLKLGVQGNTSTDTVDSASDPFLGAKYVSRLASGNYYNLEAELGLGDAKPLKIGGDYYVDNTFGIGAAYSDNLDSNYNGEGTFEVRAKKFISPMMAIGGKITTTDGDTGVAVNWTGRY